MIFCQHQNIWRTLADISACKCVWGAFIHLFAWKKYGLTDSWVAPFSEEIIKTLDEKLSTKLGRTPEENFRRGADVIYQIRPACNSPSHCCAICIALHHFILQGVGGKGPLVQRTDEPGHKSSSQSKFFGLGGLLELFLQRRRLAGRGEPFPGRRGLPPAGLSLPCPRGCGHRGLQKNPARGAAPAPRRLPAFLTQKGKIQGCTKLFFNQKKITSE